MSDLEVSSHFMEDPAFKKTMRQALRKHSNNRDRNIFGILDFIKIPKYSGTYNPSIFSWMKNLNVLLGILDIPDDIEGAFIMTYLEGVALSVVQMELPLGSFLPQKETVYKILIQNFGYKHAILSTIMDEHRRLGQIPSGQEMSLEDKTFKDICLKHLQLLHAVEEIFPDMQLIPESYILTAKHVLPAEVLRRTSFANMDNKERYFLIKMNISHLKDASRQCLIDSQILRPEKQSHVNPVRRSENVTCRVCVIISSNNCQVLRPREHNVTERGFIIKESCPELAGLSKSEKIGILKKNQICRSCLCLGTQTPLHPENDCDYLNQKNLLFLKCPAQGCRIRSTLCEKHVCHPHKYPTNRVDCVPQPRGQQCTMDAVDMNTRETVGPIGNMRNAKNTVKEKAKNIEEKSFEYKEMNSNNSDTFKERQYRSLSIFSNLVQALRILVFIFYFLVTSIKKIKRDFYKSEKIIKSQSSEVMNLQNLDSQINRSEFEPG